ncbi:hypothetical protein VU05_01390 [Desulfobulbus sp. F1]|nr:hypothetical protein [Desulfobulbus sp. F1]
MKTKLTLTVAALLLIAMLLVNMVLLVFWKRDALQREAERDQAVLLHIAFRLTVEKAYLKQGFSFTEFYSSEESGQIMMLLRDDIHADLLPLMAETATEAVQTGRPTMRASASLADLLRGQQPFLASARPVLRQGQIIGVVAVTRSLLPLFITLWQAEKIVLIYIAVNLLVLGVISFFRMTKLIVRPVERLMQLADRHTEQEAVWFAADHSGSEFNQLASSLNSMLAKIEQDRTILRTTVAELEVANRQLQERQQEMIRAEKLASVGKMAAGLAHEIGNPLAVIQGYLDLLARSGQSEENQDFLCRADQELQRVSGLIRQLLNCARVSKGRPEFFFVHALLYSVVEMVQVQSAFKQIKLTVQAEAAQDRINADPDQLRQVLLNCLLNSADAISSGIERNNGQIVLATDQFMPHFLCIRIEDNGIGITEEQLAAVFDPFYTTKEIGKGTGLGLSVSRSMVENAGGFMKMESKAGEGSTISIYLPLADEGRNYD